MVDEETGDVVDKDDKGRGYELSKGKYVEIEEDELEGGRDREHAHDRHRQASCRAPRSTSAISTSPTTSRPPARPAPRPFAVIRDAMKDKDRVALARIVMAHREHIMALEPLGKGLLGTTLRYDYEVRDEKDYFADIPSPRIAKEMVQLAAHILDSKAGHFRSATSSRTSTRPRCEAGEAQGGGSDDRAAGAGGKARQRDRPDGGAAPKRRRQKAQAAAGPHPPQAAPPQGRIEHFQEKACPGLDPGWPPVFRRKCDQISNLNRLAITRDRKPVCRSGPAATPLSRGE